ncbi:MAG TPA: site-2 protease family protein [Gemmatimonadaceae bacterium]|nr:site-2 protease family protein [Gemmatimonadaceae bacterium]
MDTLQNILFVAPVLLFSVIAHEYAHGYAALRQGDPTALMMGRLTWNPLKHISPFLTIIMPIVMYVALGVAIGGARPVPVNPRNYRNLRRGDIIVSLAGVAVNFALAFVCAVIIAVLGLLARALPVAEPSIGILQVMMWIGIQINLALLMFNLLPIPPLDGSHVVKYLLPPSWSLRYQQVGFLGLIAIVLILRGAPGFLDWWFRPADFVAGHLQFAVRSLLTATYHTWVS